jgi:hypothetical protein
MVCRTRERCYRTLSVHTRAEAIARAWAAADTPAAGRRIHRGAASLG